MIKLATVTQTVCNFLTLSKRCMITQKMTTSSETFLYFGYGSNLLRERIHIMNPTATFKTTAKLVDYMLDFNYISNRWKGAVATITPNPGSHVWGVVWEINSKDLPNLDEQEGVNVTYEPLNVHVETPEGESLTCRTYSLLIRDSDDIRPSPIYLDVIVKGAIQNGLPQYYIDKLKAIETNGFKGDIDMKAQLNKL